MATIPFDTIQAADNRSRELWTAVLGRSKHPQDVTEYAYSRTLLEDETPAIVIPERDAMLDSLIRADELTADELAALVDLYPLWSADSVQYDADAIVAYDSQLYRIVTPHTSQESWTPDATPALWEPCAPEGVVPVWSRPSGQQDAYDLDALVTWPAGGRVWKSLKAGNTDEPGAVGTWRDQSDPPLWVQPSGSIGLWQVDDVVEHEGQIWRNTSPNNSFEPGVFGWVVVNP